MDALEKVSVQAVETRNPPTPTRGGGCRDGDEWDEVLKRAYSSVSQGVWFPRASGFPGRFWPAELLGSCVVVCIHVVQQRSRWPRTGSGHLKCGSCDGQADFLGFRLN